MAYYSPPGSPRMYTDRLNAEMKSRDAAALAAAEAAASAQHSNSASIQRLRAGELSTVAATESSRSREALLSADRHAADGVHHSSAATAEALRSREYGSQAASAAALGNSSYSGAVLDSARSLHAADAASIHSSIGGHASIASAYSPSYLGSHLHGVDAAHAYGRAAVAHGDSLASRVSADRQFADAHRYSTESQIAASAAARSDSASALHHSNALSANSRASADRALGYTAEGNARAAQAGSALAMNESVAQEQSAALAAQASANAQAISDVCSAQADLDAKLQANYELATTRRALSGSPSPSRVRLAGSPLGSPLAGSPIRTSHYAGSPLRHYY